MTMASTRKHQASARDRRAQFIAGNLELLGFGNARDALIQTVKELFENALDAVITAPTHGPFPLSPETCTEMLRIRVQWNPETQQIDVVCSDTGTGIHAHKIRQLCCGVFETTKSSAGTAMNGALNCGKYGLGLKAAMLYSQQHVPAASLKIVTTAQSSEILYIELRIDSESEEPAVVQRVASYSVDEGLHQFSGTEMRISIPAPESEEDVDYAADVLAVYFQSLRYTLPEHVGVEFTLEIGEIEMQLDWSGGQQPIDRFTSDFQATVEDLVYVTHATKTHNINCMALFLGGDGSETTQAPEIEITVLRYANHVPLVNADDFFLCSLTTSVLCNRIWKKLGYVARRNTSHLMSQLAASPVSFRGCAHNRDGAAPARLIIATDVSTDVGTDATSTRYANLKKSALDKSYLKDAQLCFRGIIEQLHARGAIINPQQTRDEALLVDYAPLIANAASGILTRSRRMNASSSSSSFSGGGGGDIPMNTLESDRITVTLQRMLTQVLASEKNRTSFH